MQLESSIFLYQKGMIMSWTIFEYFSKQNMFGILMTHLRQLKINVLSSMLLFHCK